MTTATAEAMRLDRLEIRNFCRIEAQVLQLDGNHLLITGANGEGKTSIVHGLWCLINGLSVKDTPEPIRTGGDRAILHGELGDLIVDRKVSHKPDGGFRTALTVKRKDGSKPLGEPQAMLKALLSPFSLDPVAFDQRRPQDQLDDVLSVYGVKPPVARVKEITGKDHAAHPDESAYTYLERLSADKIGTYYCLRTEANRAMLMKRAARDEVDAALNAMGGAPKDDEAMSVSDLEKEVGQLEAQDHLRTELVNAHREASQTVQAGQQRLDSIKKEASSAAKTIADLEVQILALQRKLGEARDAKATLDGRIELGTARVTELVEEEARALAEVEMRADVKPRITQIREAIANAARCNETLGKRKLLAQQFKKLVEEATAAEIEHVKLDTDLAALRHLRAHLLDDVKLDAIKGLSVGDGELRLDGVPYRQASKAQRLRVACKIATLQKPHLRLLRIDEGEQLDTESKQIVFDIANQAGFQVVMTAVSDKKGLEFQIIDADYGEETP